MFLHLPMLLVLLLFAGSLWIGASAAVQTLTLRILPQRCLHGNKMSIPTSDSLWCGHDTPEWWGVGLVICVRSHNFCVTLCLSGLRTRERSLEICTLDLEAPALRSSFLRVTSECDRPPAETGRTGRLGTRPMETSALLTLI